MLSSIEELREKLESLISLLPSPDYNAIDDTFFTELDSCAKMAASLGMKEGQKLINNLSGILQDRKQGKSQDASVMIRLTAIDFYLKKLQTGDTEDL